LKPCVLFLDHTGTLGGAELFLLDVALHHVGSSSVLLFADGPFRERLEREGVAVKVLPASHFVSGIKREGSGMRDLWAVPAVLRLGWRVARIARGYDVLYANSQKAFVVSALAGKIAGKPVIWHLHDALTAEHFSRGHRYLVVALANYLAVRVIANSRATAEAFARSGGKAERVSVVYNGIDPEPFDSVTPAEVDSLREELGLAASLVIGAFSRLAPWKGQHVLLEALTRLPGVHILLVGEALFGEQAYARALRKRAEELGVADRVHFLGFREDVPRLMRVSDVVAHASVASEPFGRMIVEGMLARKPVVASRAGGTTEIVEDGVSGILFPPGDTSALTGALAGLLADPSKRRALAEAGRAVASEYFSLEAMLEGVARHIREVVTSRQQRGAGRFVGRKGS
jgi:glycosyltransferase involved in cell wall biosynthesis